jgi:hypothetical protein
MERKETPLWEEISSKTWKGISPVIRGYPSTKKGESDPLLGTSKTSNSVAQGNNWANQKAKQSALQRLVALPASTLALLPAQEPGILNIFLRRKKRLHRGEDIKKELDGTWMIN